MSRILLVDDSPHAQRLGERILTGEGFEVVTVSSGDAALIRLDDVDPDVVVADTVMPGRNGYDICHYLKLSPRHRHVRVILTAGMLDPLDEAEWKRVGADGALRKPFEATALVTAVKPLAEAVAADRALKGMPSRGSIPDVKPARPKASGPFVTVLDAERVRAAVTIALDAAMESMVDEITRRVIETLTPKPSETAPVEAPAQSPYQTAAEPAAQPEAAATEPVVKPTPPAAEPVAKPAATPVPPLPETVRRVTPVRVRSGSILGLDLPPLHSETKPAPPKSN
ncbi:MAG TPA: response regulator [Bryobacteraceae bacterium]|nr:response regulator [Bryobacteraceae bacterium]